VASKEEATRLMELFEGFASVHGTHGEPKKQPDSLKWEIKSTASTIKRPVTPEMWMAHLAGKRPLGIIPVREDSMCRWGSIDYDVYDADLVKLIKRVNDLKLPLVPCRSKSGGLHLFCFTTDFVPAATMQNVLKDVAARLGIAGSEIFPKQTQILVERGDLGSWMVMPYYGDTFGGRLKEQVGLKKNGNDMLLTEFLHAIEEKAVGEEALLELSRKRPTQRVAAPETEFLGEGGGRKGAIPGVEYPEPEVPFGDGPPCLQQLARDGVRHPHQNNTLLMMGIYAKMRYPEGWQERLEQMAQDHLDPPGRAEATAGLIKQLEKKDYYYTCKIEPMCSHCNSGLCKMQPFGVGEAGDYPDLSGMTLLETDPPLWFVNVEEGRVELSTEDLLNYSKFTIACANQVHKTFNPMKQADWLLNVKNAMRAVTKVPMPESAGAKGALFELFEDYITDRRESSTVEELFGGAPWYDKNEDLYWFRMKGFMDFLKAQGVRDRELGRNRVVSLLKGKFEMDHKSFTVKGRNFQAWHVSGKTMERFTEPLDTPQQEDAGI
jgi:hypothetical protein